MQANKRKHEVNKLVIDEEEAEVVRMMFNLCVASGFGRWRLAMFLNDKGIKNRSGQNWSDATVGAILHNVMYKGIFRSGDTYSEPFEELQIIDSVTFDRAQSLMLERTEIKKNTRTAPLNTTGQSLLSGNIFCGHCGGRLVLTSSTKTNTLKDGKKTHYTRVRYICYNRSRRRIECDGQLGYTAHVLDSMITELLHSIFDRLTAADESIIIGGAAEKHRAELTAAIKRIKAENAKANTEYESLKAEVIKAVQGKSKMPMEVLSELVDESRNKVIETSEQMTSLMAELDEDNEKVEVFKSELVQIHTWSQIFDESDLDTKKMIANYMIKRIAVFAGYKLDIELNMHIQQFLNGLENTENERAAS